MNIQAGLYRSIFFICVAVLIYFAVVDSLDYVLHGNWASLFLVIYVSVLVGYKIGAHRWKLRTAKALHAYGNLTAAFLAAHIPLVEMACTCQPAYKSDSLVDPACRAHAFSSMLKEVEADAAKGDFSNIPHVAVAMGHEVRKAKEESSK